MMQVDGVMAVDEGLVQVDERRLLVDTVDVGGQVMSGGWHCVVDGYMWIWVDAVDVGGCSDRWNYVVANAGG